MPSCAGSFEVLASHKIVGFPDGNIISWCPQMDLLAVSMNLTSIWVFRLDGERVYSINNWAKILHLEWSSSGKFFVLSGADHAIKVYDSNHGKLVNQFTTSAELPITLVSWASIDVSFSVAPDGKPAPFQDLMKIEILGNMPKLANEIDSSASGDASGVPTNTSTQYASSLVTNTTENDAEMDYLLVVNGDTNVSVTFNNLFTVTGILLPHKEFSFLKHTVAGDFFTQSFLVQDSASQLHLQDFHIDITGPRHRSYFFDTIRWASQVISIKNHINDQLCAMQTEATEFLVLYDRYLTNYKDALYADVDVMTSCPLAEETENKIVCDLGNMLLTGLISISTKDYWLNQFGERGLMRLSTMGNNVYDNVRKVLFTQLVLGLEKLIILLSYLESLSKTADVMKEINYGISLDAVQQAITLAKNLVKKVYAFIWRLNDEHEYFNQFLNWAKIEVIEKLSKEDTDPESFFTEHPTLDFKASLIMEYFADYMFDSVLIREFDIDCSAHETLVRKNHKDTSLKAQIGLLQDQLQASLSDMELFFALTVTFQPTVKLDTFSQDAKSDLHIFETGKIITSVDNSTLSVTSVDSGMSVSKMEILFPSKVIYHKLLGEHRLLLLYDVDEVTRRIDLVEFTRQATKIKVSDLSVLQSTSFGPQSVVKRPAYMTINSSATHANTMALVLDESKKDYVVLRI